MYRTKVLLLTSDKTLEDQLHGFLSGYPDRYTIFHQSEFSTNIGTYDVALIDENVIDKNPGEYLAKFTVEVTPPSLIYLTDSLDHPGEYSAVKTLAADYLYKNQLTGSGLHNCIKYALESKNLRREIEKQRNRYESLFHNAIDAAFFLTPDWKIENVNQAFLNLFGLTPELIQKLDFETLINDIEDFNEFFNTDFSDEEADTVGGLVMHAFGHLPAKGEQLEINGFIFKVAHADRRRLLQLQVKLPSSQETSTSENI